MKNILRSMLLALMLLVSNPGPANSISIPLPISTPGQSRTEVKLCEIRRIFCGNMAIAILGFAAFLLGIMILDRKAHWSIGILFIAGASVFTNANGIVTMFGRANFAVFIMNPICDCGTPGVNFERMLGDWLNGII